MRALWRHVECDWYELGLNEGEMLPLCIRGFPFGDMILINTNQFSLIDGDEPAHASSTVTR